MFTVQARDAPDVLRVVSQLQPFGTDENRARTGFLGFCVVGNPDSIQIEIIVFGAGKESDGVVHRRKAPGAATHRRYPPIPDDFVIHDHALLQHDENFGRETPGQENVKAAVRFQFWQCCVDPLFSPEQIGRGIELIGIVAVILAQAVGRIGQQQIDRAVGDALQTLQRVFAIDAVDPVVAHSRLAAAAVIANRLSNDTRRNAHAPAILRHMPVPPRPCPKSGRRPR